MTNKKCYSADGEIFYDDLSTVLDMIICDMELDYADIFSYYEAEAVERNASHYVDVYRLLEDISDQTWDDVGEFSGDWPDLSLEETGELQTLICNYIQEKSPINFYSVRNVVERKISKAELLGESNV